MLLFDATLWWCFGSSQATFFVLGDVTVTHLWWGWKAVDYTEILGCCGTCLGDLLYHCEYDAQSGRLLKLPQ